MNRPLTILSLLLVALPLAAQTEGESVPGASPRSLAVGDPAPPLKPSKYLKGEPIAAFEKGQIYVIDCWATWCGPCIRAIPHMTEVQKRHTKDGVHVIGVSIWESDQSAVAPFVEGKGDTMNYRVALDDVPPLPEGMDPTSREARGWATRGAVASTWMEAAGRNGIPTVFVVDRESRLAWIGHPMSGMDAVIEQLVAGTYDLEKAARQYREEQALEKSRMEFGRFLQARQYDEAMKLARAHVSKEWSQHAALLNMVAWTIVDPEGPITEKDLDLAFDAAVRANELTGGKDAAILDTLARVHFLKGSLERAIELQRHAVEQADEAMRPDLQRVLDEYLGAAKERMKPEQF